jgi:hypothetical protein
MVEPTYGHKDKMTEENDEAINEDALDESDPSQDQGAVDSEDGGQSAPEQNAGDRNWQAANETMRQQRERIQRVESELENLRSSSKPAETKKSLFDGRDKEDYPTFNEIEGAFEKKERQLDATIAELNFKAAHPGGKEIIDKYGKQLDPSVRLALGQSGSWEAAYNACIDSTAYYKDHVAKEQNTAAAKAKENLSKPGSVSSVGGVGAMSDAAKFENMNDADILALSRKYRQGG